jgi:uncharacterized membrane protein
MYRFLDFDQVFNALYFDGKVDTFSISVYSLLSMNLRHYFLRLYILYVSFTLRATEMIVIRMLSFGYVEHSRRATLCQQSMPDYSTSHYELADLVGSLA